MNKIEKFLKRLSRDERVRVAQCIERIVNGKWGANLDIKKLKGYDEVYRVRVGNIRIIFFYKNKKTSIIAIERRSDNTY
ncbi:MAG: type II toxin-antitoxin system RelE/ParE family toxin [Patescibacteria group bacterium]